MSNTYGQADPGSILQNAPNYGAAVASLMPAPLTAAASGGQPFVPNKWKGSFRRELAGGAGDFGYETAPGQWAPLPQDVRNSNQPTFGNNALDTIRGQIQKKEDEATKERISAAAAAQQQAELDLRLKGLEATIASNQASNALGLAQLQQQGELTRGQLQLNRDQLAATTTENQANRTQQASQFDATMQQQTRQLELNNQIQSRRLDIEDRHFQQQAALDERNARRTKVLGSLSLIAQSLQRL